MNEKKEEKSLPLCEVLVNKKTSQRRQPENTSNVKSISA